MDCDEALKISREVSKLVRKEVKSIAGKKFANKSVGIGKDGTPTKFVDKIAEDVALKVLLDYGLKVVTEESGMLGNGDVVVALDPVDGTYNAARGIPIYSVSMCFANCSDSYVAKYKDAFFGYVCNLATGDEYWAGEIAYKNGDEVKTSQVSEIKETNAIIYYPEINYGFKRVRIFGSASLEICFVADGSVDCFIDIRKGHGKGMLRVYDVVAGLYIAEKAGAKVTTPLGESIKDKLFNMDERFMLVVANYNLHEKLLSLFKGE